MGWSLEDLKDSLKYGTLYRVVRCLDSQTAVGAKLKLAGGKFKARGDLVVLRIGHLPDTVVSLQDGDLLFAEWAAKEVSVLRPGTPTCAEVPVDTSLVTAKKIQEQVDGYTKKKGDLCKTTSAPLRSPSLSLQAAAFLASVGKTTKPG